MPRVWRGAGIYYSTPNTMKYKATKDVPYFGIKAGDLLVPFLDRDDKYYLTFSDCRGISVELMLQLGAIEEYKPLPRLTVESIKEGEIYWYTAPENDTGTNYLCWGGIYNDKNIARLGIFRTEKEAIDHFKKLCEYSDKLLANDETV